MRQPWAKIGITIGMYGTLTLQSERFPASRQGEESRWVRGGSPLDTWLRQGLGAAYGSVMDEPVPDALRRLVSQAGET